MNTFFRYQTAGQNHPGKRKTTMKNQNQLTNAIAPVGNKHARSPWRRLIFIIPLASGSYNTAFGDEVLQFNTVGNNNTAIGAAALYANTNGNSNTASGVTALLNNTSGSSNTATGFAALDYNNGDYNTASGANALYS